MGAVDNQINWRKVFQDTPGDLKVTTTPDGITGQLVTQDTAGNLRCMTTPDGITEQLVRQAIPGRLKCVNTPDGVTAQPVTQATPALLKCTNTPDGTTAQPVSQVSGVHGIWPASNSLRINKTGYQGVEGGVNVYTVPVGKKLYITDSFLSSRLSADADARAQLTLKDVGEALKYYLQSHYYALAGQMAAPTRYVPALEAVATDIVKLESVGADVKCRAVINGWLEDV